MNLLYFELCLKTFKAYHLLSTSLKVFLAAPVAALVSALALSHGISASLRQYLVELKIIFEYMLDMQS